MLVEVVTKIADDILAGRNDDSRHNLVDMLENVYKLGTVSRIPGSFSYFSLNISQSDNWSMLLFCEKKTTIICLCCGLYVKSKR